MDKAHEVRRWRESDVFTPLERDGMEYAEATTWTPPTVTAELSARLLEPLGPAGLVELTSFMALANFMAHSNVAMGTESQDFAATYDLNPLASELARRTQSLCSKTWSNHSAGIELRAVTIVRLDGIGLATEPSRLLERSSDRAHDRFYVGPCPVEMGKIRVFRPEHECEVRTGEKDLIRPVVFD